VQCGLHRHPLLHLQLAQVTEGKPTRSAGPPAARAPEAARQQGLASRAGMLTQSSALPCCRGLGPVRWLSAERAAWQPAPGQPICAVPGPRMAPQRTGRRARKAPRRGPGALSGAAHLWAGAGLAPAARCAMPVPPALPPANTRPAGGSRSYWGWLPPGPQPSGTTCKCGNSHWLKWLSEEARVVDRAARVTGPMRRGFAQVAGRSAPTRSLGSGVPPAAQARGR
jgi:hypothetical protein